MPRGQHALAAPLFEGTLAWTRGDADELVRAEDIEDEEVSPCAAFTPARGTAG